MKHVNESNHKEGINSEGLKIGIVTKWFERGAAYVSRAYHSILSRRHNVFIYARGGIQYAQGDPRWDSDYVTWGKRRRLGIPQFIDWADFRNWVQQNQLDVIIFNEQQSWDIILRCLQLDVLIGAYVDYYTHDTVPFFKLYDFLLCNTRRHYSVFQDHPQAIYIPWGTDCSVFKGHHEPVSDNSVTFFHSCGLNPYRKGTDILVKAFQHVRGDARLIIHSQGPFTWSDTMNIARRDPRITIVEEIVGPPGLYHLGDVYVYPSRLDGIGLSMAEALACGLPLITVDNGPMNEFVKPDVNGLLVPVEQFQQRSDGYYWKECICQASSLAEAMQYYVDNRSKLSEFKQKARVYAEEHLDWSTNSMELPEILQEFYVQMKPRSLVLATAWYEYTRYPRLIGKALLKKARGLILGNLP